MTIPPPWNHDLAVDAYTLVVGAIEGRVRLNWTGHGDPSCAVATRPAAVAEFAALADSMRWRQARLEEIEARDR